MTPGARPTRDTLAVHHQRLTGVEAARRLIAEAEREEFLAVELVIRALRCTRRTLLKDWKKRGHSVTTVGRQSKLPSRLVVAAYFPHLPQPAATVDCQQR